MKVLIAIAFIFLTSCTYKQKCTKVLDGDTIVMQDHKRIRLYEIDAPETGQQGGKEAKEYLSSLVLNKVVEIKKVGTDKYGRDICKLYRHGAYINELMVISGNAWAYKNFSSKKLHNEELEAINKRVGLWASNAIPPYIFRKTNHKP